MDDRSAEGPSDQGSAAPTAAPGDEATLRRAARRARQSQDWEALRRAGSALRALTPDSRDAVLIEAAALRRLGRAPEAHALMRQLRARFGPASAADRNDAAGPTPIDAAMPDARALRAALDAAAKAKDWAGLKRASAALRAAAPDDARGYQHGARALRHLGRFQAAEALSALGADHCPGHAGILAERATILLRLKRVEEAAACFALTRAARPGLPQGWVREADALVRLGRFAAADLVLAEGLQQFPGHAELLAQSALCAACAGDFPAARDRWEALRQVAPDDIRLRNAFGGVDFAEKLETVTDLSAPPQDAAPEALGARDDAAVLRRFESLGGDCEFGLVQRAGGIEPLGLLRFAGIRAEELIAMLRAGLAGVGEAENTRLSLTINNEYWMEDTRYFRTHTFLTLGAGEEASVLQKLCKRTVFLREKLLNELRQGNKIMLFRPKEGVIDDTTITALHDAVRALGPSSLLCVRDTAAGDGGAGDDAVSVRCAGDGLFIGAMPGKDAKLNLQYVGQHRYALWLRLCCSMLEQIG